MRTKALLLAAAFCAAGIATCLAQSNVYSLNVVGYVNVDVPAKNIGGSGFRIIGNPLIATNNSLSTIMPNAWPGTRVYQYHGASPVYYIAEMTLIQELPPLYDWDNNLTIAQGEGFWIKNPSNSTMTVTFVGEVAQGNLTNSIPAGFALRSSIVPQAGVLTTDLGYPATMDVSRVYLYRAGVGGYTICNYQDDGSGNPIWDNTPNLLVADGFWSREPAQTNWIRVFNVQ